MTYKIKISLSFVYFLALSVYGVAAKDTLTVVSPSEKIRVAVWLDQDIKYAVWYDGKMIFQPSAINMIDGNGKRFFNELSKIKSANLNEYHDTIVSPIGEKRKNIKDHYRLLNIQMKDPYALQVRVYDDGFAYRITTALRDSIIIQSEIAKINFPQSSSAYIPIVAKRDNVDEYHTSFEELYQLLPLKDIRKEMMGYSPVLVIPANSSLPKIGITESDLEDYPGMFIGGTADNSLIGIHAGYPAEERLVEGEFPQMVVSKRADFIAKTKGKRTYPWRVFIVAEHDKDLPSSDMVYRLASPSRLQNTDWIKPGNLTDEWITDVNLFNVPFRAGINTASYMYYIDFANRFGFDRIMMDAGWSDNNNLFKINPAISMDSIIAHSRKQGVKLGMWTLARTLDKQLDSALDRFQQWGIDFIMTDFIDRDDQKAVNFHFKIAEAAAKRNIMVMFHGTFPAKGFDRTYPHAVAREGVMGSEYNIWGNKLTPEHDLILPFTRMLAGGFDYEPGLLNNATEKGTRPVVGVVTSPGTRSHQLAMFVVYDSPMQIFSGNPSEAYLEPAFMELLGAIPTTWDETIILDAKVGDYIITARRKGSDWYIAGMSDWQKRDIILKFDFLEQFQYKATICKDGINADRYAADYALTNNHQVKKGDSMSIHFAPGGGFLIKLEKIQ
jgi:alpha-glucosidase